MNLFPLIAGPETRAEPIYYTETGGMRTCAKLAGIDLEDFRKLSRKANILVVVQATSIRGRTSKACHYLGVTKTSYVVLSSSLNHRQ